MISTTYYDHRSHQLLPLPSAGGGSDDPAARRSSAIHATPHLLASAKLKLEGADGHIKDLAHQISAFFQTDPKPFRSYVEVEGAKQVFKVQLNGDLPGAIYNRIGDALSNTRSALDHLVGALAVKNGKTAGEANFPITDDQKRFEDKRIQRIEEVVGKDAWSMICELKPYRGGADLLWSLNTLRNKDTHETVAPIAWGVTQANFHVRIHLPEAGTVEMVNSPIGFDENKVARIWRIPANATIFDGETQFSLDIAFTKVPTVEGQPVVATLGQFLDFTRRTVSLFEERFLA